MAKRRQIVLTGDKKLNRMLKRLSSRDAKTAIREAARPAMRPVRTETKRLAPKRTGALRKAVRVRATPRSRSSVGIRVTIGARNFVGDQFYGGMIEWGWQLGKRGGPRGRKIPGQEFMKRAANGKRDEALGIYRRELRQVILKLAKT